MNGFGWVVVALIAARLLAQLLLDRLNRRHVLAHALAVPPPLVGIINDTAYAQSVQYTLARNRLHSVELIFDAVVLLICLFSGVLPWLLECITQSLGPAPWSLAVFLLVAGIGVSLTGLPFSWYTQFRLEERFGFNTMTQGLWLLDLLKGFALAGILGFPLTWLLLKVAHWTGAYWWLWAWGTLIGFQLLMMVLGPALILPLFNKFAPLPEGSLRDKLLELAKRTEFAARSIQVMDGSKRSRHSNAFFTGFGRLRKIVLFDTLIQQLNETELQAVLAHEIGHYKHGHIVKLLAVSALTTLAGFAALNYFSQQPWFYTAFDFTPGKLGPALLLFVLLSGLVTFWFSPLTHAWSRRHEYEADAFAAAAMSDPQPLTQALRKLNEKNLGNLTPHPLYSGFYYSHPTLIEREAALTAGRVAP
jgi:STE24 endopeptidase